MQVELHTHQHLRIPHFHRQPSRVRDIHRHILLKTKLILCSDIHIRLPWTSNIELADSTSLINTELIILACVCIFITFINVFTANNSAVAITIISRRTKTAKTAFIIGTNCKGMTVVNIYLALIFVDTLFGGRTDIISLVTFACVSAFKILSVSLIREVHIKLTDGVDTI